MLSIKVSRKVTDNALLIVGGIDYNRECSLWRINRDVRLTWLEEGAPTIHYVVAARRILAGQRTYEMVHEEVVENPIERHIRLNRKS